MAASEAAAPTATSGKQKRKDNGFVLKTPKGTRDYMPGECKVREEVIDKIRSVFRRHGGTAIETPVFELKETLTGKYGEDSKLIYDLADQGGEICALRYDLTVPFARYCAMNKVTQMKRYQIGRVYRRDQPIMTKGRYREFYQCDFDICGEFDPMMADAEVLAIASEALSNLDLGYPFVIKVNHRGLIDGIFACCGVPADKFRPICSAVDKLDKLSWDEVKKEMTDEKGLDADVAERIGGYVRRGSMQVYELLDELLADPALTAVKAAKDALTGLGLLFKYLEAFGALTRVRFDLSLARGLDYYTGMIFEAVLEGTDGIGSISGGGRYDGLIGMFAAVGKKGKKPPKPTPCVGFSLGIERIFAILCERALPQESDTVLLLTQTPMDSVAPEVAALYRMRVARQMWDGGFAVEVLPKIKPNFKNTFTYAEFRKIPYLGLISQPDIDNLTIDIKDLKTGDQVKMPVDQVVDYITRREQAKKQASPAVVE